VTNATTHVIDLRSDTVTQPTPEMRRAMAEADLGDDVYREDPTVNRLEVLAAGIMGKEAALFVTSGSMGNLVSGLAWCDRGTEAIIGAGAHILINEMGSLAALGGVQMRAVPTDVRGLPDPAAVATAIRPTSGFFPRTAMVELENTHNSAGGTALTVEQMRTVADVAHERDVPVHLDGARVFDAAVATGVPASEIAACVDSLTFCLSKGLACPVGSVVCGTEEFIAKARRMRKLVGGGMRQAGVLAAAGIWALEHMVDRLAEDHANARRLADGLRGVPGIKVRIGVVETNMVYLSPAAMSAEAFIAGLRERGVLCGGGYGLVRLVTHYGVNAEDIDEALDVIGAVARAS